MGPLGSVKSDFNIGDFVFVEYWGRPYYLKGGDSGDSVNFFINRTYYALGKVIEGFSQIGNLTVKLFKENGEIRIYIFNSECLVPFRDLETKIVYVKDSNLDMSNFDYLKYARTTIGGIEYVRGAVISKTNALGFVTIALECHSVAANLFTINTRVSLTDCIQTIDLPWD